MNGASRMLMSAWHEYCDAMWARNDIADQTRWEQMVKFGYGIQWLTTGTFAIDAQGWAQQQLRNWGFSEAKSPASGHVHMTTEDYISGHSGPRVSGHTRVMEMLDAGADIAAMVDWEKDEK